MAVNESLSMAKAATRCASFQACTISYMKFLHFSAWLIVVVSFMSQRFWILFDYSVLDHDIACVPDLQLSPFYIGAGAGRLAIIREWLIVYCIRNSCPFAR